MSETALTEDNEISLFDLAIALGREKRILFGIPFMFTLGAVIYTLTLTPIYTATTTVAQAQAPAQAQAQAQAQQLVTLLKSRTIQETLVEQFNLKQMFAVESPSSARRALESMTRITADKISGVITVEVDDKDPAFAARLANGYTQALRYRLDEMETAPAKQRRAFYAELIQRLKSHPEDTAEVSILTRARLREILNQKEADYAVLHESVPRASPVLQRRIKELHLLNAQLNTLEQAFSQFDSTNSGGRNKVILDILTWQHEQARLDAAREPTLLQLIDIATPPEQKSKPKRAQIVGLAGVFGLFLGMLGAFVRGAWRKAGENQQFVGRIAELKRAWAIHNS